MKGSITLKKNTGAQLALYPAPVIVVGAMVDGKPNWTLVAHAGIMAHSHLMLSMVKAHYTNKGIRENRVVSVKVMNRLSVDCDCDGNPAEPDVHDIGILASTDPVALDQACIDLVWQAEGNESLVRRIESRDGLHTLEYAAEIGLGSRTYNLVDLDA